MDNRAAQKALLSRITKIAKKDGYAKSLGGLQRVSNEVVQLIDWSRSQPREDHFEFTMYLGVFSPEFHYKVYKDRGEGVYYQQVRANIRVLQTGGREDVWIACNEITLANGLEEMESAFYTFGNIFFESLNTTEKVVKRCKDGGPHLRKSAALAFWESSFYEGNATMKQRPGPPDPNLGELAE